MSKEIPLTQGKVAIVDDADFDWLNQWKWHYAAAGYAARATGGRRNRHILYMHRLIVDAPAGSHVDHRDHNGLNNQRSNLRIATPSQNHYNARRNHGSSKYKGVYYSTARKMWVATIHADHRRIHLGTFATELCAALAYNSAAIQYHGEFALLNDLSDHIEPDVEILSIPEPTSRYLGVYFDKSKNKWRAFISVDRRQITLGTFTTEQDAIVARREAEVRYAK